MFWPGRYGALRRGQVRVGALRFVTVGQAWFGAVGLVKLGRAKAGSAWLGKVSHGMAWSLPMPLLLQPRGAGSPAVDVFQPER